MVEGDAESLLIPTLADVIGYSFEEKAEILSEIYNQRNFNKNDARTVDSLFKATMFKEVQRLEYDIQNFS